MIMMTTIIIITKKSSSGGANVDHQTEEEGVAEVDTHWARKLGWHKTPFLPKRDNRDSWGKIIKGCEVWKADSQK